MFFVQGFQNKEKVFEELFGFVRSNTVDAYFTGEIDYGKLPMLIYIRAQCQSFIILTSVASCRLLQCQLRIIIQSSSGTTHQSGHHRCNHKYEAHHIQSISTAHPHEAHHLIAVCVDCLSVWHLQKVVSHSKWHFIVCSPCTQVLTIRTFTCGDQLVSREALKPFAIILSSISLHVSNF